MNNLRELVAFESIMFKLLELPDETIYTIIGHVAPDDLGDFTSCCKAIQKLVTARDALTRDREKQMHKRITRLFENVATKQLLQFYWHCRPTWR